jgi:hypothetical protein
MIQTLVSPYTSPLRWDYIECAGVVSPGVIPKSGVHGFDRRYNFDPKNGYGMFGSVLTFALRPAAEGSFTIWTWTAEQYDSMGNFLSVLEYDPTKTKVQAIDIFHPALAVLGIRRVVTNLISPPKHMGGKKYEWTVGFIEFRPPPKISAVSTPVATKKKPAQEDDPDLDKMINDLNPQYQKSLQDARGALGF